MYNVTNHAYFKQNAREIDGGVYIYADIDSEEISSTLYKYNNLASITIEKSSPAGKFFGFSIAQELKIEVIGKIDIAKGTKIRPYINQKGYEETKFPYFYIESVEENEVKNKTVITAYDLMRKAEKHTISEVDITYPIDVDSLASKIVTFLGGFLYGDRYAYRTGLATFSLQEETVNLSGSETLREVLEALAEVSGAICYCDDRSKITYRQMNNQVVDTITADSYFDFSIKDEIFLTQIAAGTQLGDNIFTGIEGYTQVIWDNPFLTLREDAANLLESMSGYAIGLGIAPFNFSWRGNPFYEIGDYIQVTTAKGETKYIRYLTDTMTYNGGLRCVSSWEGAESENINMHPSSIGQVISQTVATVDKANKQIQLMVSEVAETSEKVAQLEVNSESINASVSSLEKAVGNFDEDMATLVSKVESTMSAEDIEITIQQTIKETGVDEVTTTTGFTFNADGLTISKDNSELSTQITEDGMTISRVGQEVLDVNNAGVYARNLQATTFLLIGENSRFEDYNNNTRTGCFWIGF